MSAGYLNPRLMPRYAASSQTQLRLSPGDGLKGLPSSPAWY
jgi:hypothetical protein